MVVLQDVVTVRVLVPPDPFGQLAVTVQERTFNGSAFFSFKGLISGVPANDAVAKSATNANTNVLLFISFFIKFFVKWEYPCAV